jgi:hypothetical protein
MTITSFVNAFVGFIFAVRKCNILHLVTVYINIVYVAFELLWNEPFCFNVLF